MPKKLILKCGYSPGDIVLLSGAVRDLHLHYPGEFMTDVRTRCPEIWEHNPYVQPLRERDREVRILDCWYPLIDKSNAAPYHCLHGFTEFFNQKLGLQIKPTVFKGDIHLSAQEKAWFSQVRESTRKDIPFWIIAAGGKYDLTIKWWETSRYQEVVDCLQGKIQFVQVGAYGHHHPKLNGVIDLRGETNLRELIRLVYHAQGVLCSVTGIMHLAAAVETKDAAVPLRPTVVVAGGREPSHWEAYPGHQFIHTIGALPCCRDGGCWRDRIAPLRDGDRRDRPENLCVDIRNGLPHCLDMITAAEVVKRIEMYAEGGVIEYLSADEREAAEKGVTGTRANPYDSQPLNLHSAGLACEEAIQDDAGPAPNWQGRGIVICAGGVKYFTSAWVCLNMLRRLGCNLPVEVWHLGKKEMTPGMSQLLAGLNARTVDAFQVRKRHPMRRLGGWELKPYSILHSSFKEVLFLDADNVPVVNPEFLFETKQFKATGAVFWPDFDYVTGRNPSAVWKSCGLRRPCELEFETGQILIDKIACLQALRLCVWFNGHSDFYYQYLHGDKETFHLAFRKLKKSYSFVRRPIHALKATMCQHDFEGRRIFQHRNLDKWDLMGNSAVKGFWFEKECMEDVAQLRAKWDGSLKPRAKSRKMSSATQNKPRIAVGLISDGEGAEPRLTAENFGLTDWAGGRLAVESLAEEGSLSKALENAIRACLERSPDYILLLRGALTFNRHLHHNLVNWEPVRARRVKVASLHNSYVREFACDFKNNARLVDPGEPLDDAAILIHRDVAELYQGGCIRRNGSIRWFAKCAQKLRHPVFFHAPSLVKRLPSRKNAPAVLPVMDFDAEWKA